jgi:transcriptional regulator with PAS, ATPase and Fis domain
LRADVRIVAATNKDLQQMIAAGEFREDLYYRLSVITIHLPPLRDRQDDVLLLASYFINHYNSVYAKQVQGLSEEVEWFFRRHEWPGNVRELKNCIERAIIFCEHNLIEVGELAAQYADLVEGQTTTTYKDAFESLNREMILDALEKSDGVKQKAADLLNISRRTLYNRMKKLGLQ